MLTEEEKTTIIVLLNKERNRLVEWVSRAGSFKRAEKANLRVQWVDDLIQKVKIL